MIKYLIPFFAQLPFIVFAQPYSLTKSETNISASFRGLSIVNNKVAWVSGTDGIVGHTDDGGVSWSFNTVKGFESADFRSIYAFDETHAIIANAGSPALILITNDKGKNWKSVYTNSHSDAFFDGIDFWNTKEGIIYGDPIDGTMLMLITQDGGNTWKEIKESPRLESGEVSFAASGTGIRCTKKNKITISTGGAVSRLWISKDKGMNWSNISTPMIQGKTTTGIFSFTQNSNVLIIVGGDYKNESMNTNHNFYSLDGGNHWQTPTIPTRGYRECVESITKSQLISVGPSGLDISYDNGITWQPLSDAEGLHVIRKARKGSLVIIAGAKGKLFVLK